MWRVVNVFAVLGLFGSVLGCSGTTGPDHKQANGGSSLTGPPRFEMDLPPGSCGAHSWNIDGGSGSGGVTFYQSNCEPIYTAFWYSGGQLQQYDGSFAGGQAAGEHFCVDYHADTLGAYSCWHTGEQGFDWCEVDPCCSGAHPYHEQMYGNQCEGV